MKFQFKPFLLALVAGTAFFLVYFRYLPLVFPFQTILISLCLLVFLVTVFHVTSGTLLVVFFIPLVNSIPYFFSLKELNPLIFVFYSFFIGFLMHHSFSSTPFITKNTLTLPITGAAALTGVSALLAFWRYTNFFPLFDKTVYELTVNVIDVKAGGALERIVFDALIYAGGFIWFFIVLNQFQKKKVLSKALILLAVSTFVSFGFGLVQYYFDLSLGNTSYFISIDRVNGLFSDPNALGVFTAFTLPIFMGAFFEFPKKKKLIFLLPVIAGIWLLPGSGSRSGFLGIIIAGVMMGIFYLKRALAYRKKNPSYLKKALLSFSVIFMIGFLLFVLVFMDKSTLGKRFRSDLRSFSAAKDFQSVSNARADLWEAGFMMWKENPLTGIGVGAFTVELPNYYWEHEIRELKYHKETDSLSVAVDTADNLYIQILSEMGLIGLAFYLWIFYLIIREIFRKAYKIDLESPAPDILIGISAGLISMMVMFVFGIHTLNFEVQLIFWLAVAVLFFPESESRDQEKNIKLKRISTAVLVAVFSGFLIGGTWNDLSLKSRIERFDLSHNFGFYRPEIMQGRRFQWTKKNAGMTVQANNPVLHVSVLASHPDIQENPVTLELYFIKELFRDKKQLDQITIEKSTWIDLEYDLSEELGSEGILLFKVSRTWQPIKMTGALDPRPLGVAISNLKFKKTVKKTVP